jgi:hypothetical protein
MTSYVEPNSTIQSELDLVLFKLSSGEFQEVLNEAQKLLSRVKEKLHVATCHFLIGSSLKELGETDLALTHFLESTISFPIDQPFLVGHAQLEVSIIQYEKGLHSSALFFVDMAITNLGLLDEQRGTDDLRKECARLKEQILNELG